MRWIRLDCAWASSEWLTVLSAEARLAWVELLCYVKAYGAAGRVRAESSARFAHRCYLGEESVRQMLKAAENDGALLIENGEWFIVKWAHYQGDATGADRQQRYRKARIEPDSEHNNTESNGSNALHNACNACNGDIDNDNDIDNDTRVKQKKQQRGTRLPKDWHPSEADLKFCRETRPDLRGDEVAEGFRDYWHSKAGAQATKLDWSATWRNWVRGQKPGVKPKNPYSDLSGLAEKLKRDLGGRN